jgi:oligosaccharyltransferase complex subunit beta
MRWLLPFLLLVLLSVVQALSSSGNNLLVILEELAEKSKYSKYLADLEGKRISELWSLQIDNWWLCNVGRGFKITYEPIKSETVGLFHLGERAYDHLLILPPKSKGNIHWQISKKVIWLQAGLGPNLTPKILLDFINAGGNILLTLSSSTPTPSALVSLLLELDIHLPTDRNALVVDHFNYDSLSAADKHDVLLVPRPDAIRPDVKNFFRGDGKGGEVIAFPRGVGQTLGNTSPLLTPVLRAPRTAYSYNPRDDVEGVEEPFAVGEQLSLITTMQARNSARFTVIGAAEMLENTWFDNKVKSGGKESKTVNQAFAKEVTGWTFNEIGVLQVGMIEHFLNEGGVKSNITNPKIYRVKNEVVSNSCLA